MLKDFYKTYIDVGFDDKGTLNKFNINCPETFNFAYDIVDRHAQDEPDARALLYVNPKGVERTFTFAELSKYSTKAANLFASKGIKYGDTVMLVLKSHYQFWLAMLGLEKIGAVAVPATHMLTAKDYIYRFEQAEIKHIVITGDDPNVAKNAEDACTELGNVLLNKFIVNGVQREGWFDFDAEVEAQPDTMTRVQTDAKDMLLLYFTSGTTGYPKMVWHNHRYSLAHTQTALWLNNRYGGLHLTIADTGWAKAMWGKMYGQLIMGTAIFVYDYDRFNALEMLEVVSKYKVTSFCAPPTMYRFFIQEDVKQFDLSALEYCVTAGEALNPEVFDRWYEFTGHKLMEGFGQTESVIMIATMPGMMPKPGSMGKPLPLYAADIVDENDNPVPAGEVGEICIKVERGWDSGLFGGYHKHDDLTDSVWHDGWYHTGDTAWKDEDGYFWYVGRNDDMIKSSGYRIGPFEVESVLMTHPLVMECAITGAPDPVRGQVVKATIVLVKGAEGSPELIKELQKHVTDNTAPYKYPRIIEFVPELPKTISGKIRRVQIRKEDNA